VNRVAAQAPPGPPESGAAALDWQAESATWPHVETSRFYAAGGLRWHVQRMGRGPQILLVHGTGASTHSWRNVAPLLAERFTVIVPDLPAHGFSERPARARLSLPFMAESIAALVAELALRPALVVGHSAGAAILLRCSLDQTLAPVGIVSVNGALLPFRGAAGFLFPPLAKLMFLNPLMPRLIAGSAANRERVERVIRDTGSKLDESGLELYGRLFRQPLQVAAALGMMANWDLHRFARDLSTLATPLLLIAGDNDRAVPAEQAQRVARRVAGARVECLPGLGHLAHEEDPAAVAARIGAFAERLGIAADAKPER